MLEREQIVYNSEDGRFYESKIEVLSFCTPSSLLLCQPCFHQPLSQEGSKTCIYLNFVYFTIFLGLALPTVCIAFVLFLFTLLSSTVFLITMPSLLAFMLVCVVRSQGREEFCAVDQKTGKPIVLSVAEKERVFVDALQAYFFDGRQVRNTCRGGLGKKKCTNGVRCLENSELVLGGGRQTSGNFCTSAYRYVLSSFLIACALMSLYATVAQRQGLRPAEGRLVVGRQPCSRAEP